MEQYLKDSPQIKITADIKKITKDFKKEGLDLILEILKWITENIKEIELIKEKSKLFRQRTAEEIIKSKKATGCTDYALAFIALTRSRGIPTRYIEAIRRKWLDTGDENHIEGHIFAECYINNKWYKIDPQQGCICMDYKRFIIFKKGLDSWDIGIKNLNDLKKQFLDFKKRKMLKLK